MSDLGDLTRFVQHNDPRSANESYTIKTIWSSSETSLKEIDKKEAHLQQLLKGVTDEKSSLIQTIAYCRMAISPHRNLHDEILWHIFSILSMDHGPVLFPLYKNKTIPPQWTVTHVCRKWRRVAQSMGELWNNINISNVRDARSRRLWLRWLLRAGSFPVTLGINLTSVPVKDTENIFLGIILGNHSVEKLSIRLLWEQFSELKDLPAEAYSMFKDVRISLKGKPTEPLHELPRFAQQISGFYSEESDVLSQMEFPWSQIRYLKDIRFNSPITAFRFLEQVPLLEELGLSVSTDETRDESVQPLQTLTLHHLRVLTLDLTRIKTKDSPDWVLEHLKCPNIVELDVKLLNSHSNTGTYQLLKQGYNLCRLEEFSIQRSHLGSRPVSVILQDAPMLRHISLPEGIIWDDEAFTGLSTGALGRSLLSISLNYSEMDLNKILQTISTRQENAKLMNQNARSWKEEITSLKVVQFREFNADIAIRKRVRTLKRLGLEVVFNGSAKLARKPVGLYNLP